MSTVNGRLLQTILEEYINFVVQCAGPEESAVKSGIQGLELRGEKENLTKAKVGEFRILYFVFILFSLFEPRITEKTSTLKLKIDVESCSDTSVPSQYHSILKLKYSTARNYLCMHLRRLCLPQNNESRCGLTAVICRKKAMVYTTIVCVIVYIYITFFPKQPSREHFFFKKRCVYMTVKVFKILNGRQSGIFNKFYQSINPS